MIPLRPDRLCALGIACSLAAAPLSAWALDWERREQAVRIAPLQDEVEVEFPFVNARAQPVTITDVQTNCDCLEARAEPRRIAPGARGVVRARFSVGDRLGVYERAVLVLTDEGPPPVRLAVKVDVPAVAEISPRTVSWEANAPADARAIEITVAPEVWINFSAAVSTGPGFAVRLEPLEEGRLYRVHVSPESTARRASTAIRIRGTARSGREIVVSAYAYVR